MTPTPTFLPATVTSRLNALYVTDEQALVSALVTQAALTPQNSARIQEKAAGWVTKVRAATARIGMVDAFLQEYGLSTSEGIILMRLSEALIRTPDFATAQELMRDKLMAGDWDEHTAGSPTGLVNAATAGLRLSSAWIAATGGDGAAKLAAKLGDRVLHAAVVRGMGIMARHFVLGATIGDAVARAKHNGQSHALCSFDMLGEGAITQGDADRYFEAYKGAITYLAGHVGKGARVATAHGLSVKLSALHPRYEYAKRDTCVPVLIEKVRALALIAKQAGIGLSLDAEEVDRLEMSLHIFTALLTDPALADWDGLGIVIQAYQRRATAVIEAVVAAAKAGDRSIAVRLVKGAYWDGEIKRAQEMGLESYPLFTRKEHTDISYLACAKLLLDAGPRIYPQFATHNAHTAAAILEMAGDNKAFEFQRLHGMGDALHDQIRASTGITSRVYAPVGSHKELLPYLVRRLLENGANSSFVNQLMNPDIEVDDIVADPIEIASVHSFSPHPAIRAPRDLFGGTRLAAKGIDLTRSDIAAQIEGLPIPALDGVAVSSPDNVDRAVRTGCASTWARDFGPLARAECLVKMADLLEANMHSFLALCVAEAGKTYPDAIAEVREAIDFCRYYAGQAVTPALQTRMPLGVVACISPWNFPLAIFLGQVCAALVAGNTVVAKPAPQTPRIAMAATKLLYEAGVPTDALQVVIGQGDIGAALVGHTGVDGICFTGSTATAQTIVATRAKIGRADSVLIAETGGINAMIVDSTALLEQAVGDVVASAFQSAGQRCSACRVVCIQEDVALDFKRLLAGAIALLDVADPSKLATDVGPMIDAAAAERINAYVATARTRFPVIAEAGTPNSAKGHFVRPIALRVNALSDVTAEIFGPVLHVVHFAAGNIMALVDQINASGFGLTLSVHSRIDARIRAIGAGAHVGNIYVNRNQIGAVVGVQPFGGEGLSGTGPKAGGPHYLLRLSRMVRDVDVEAKDLGDRISALRTKVALPGPTGEENSLQLIPRGAILCVGGDDDGDLVRQVLLTLAMGCSPLVARADITPAHMATITASGVADGALRIVDDADLVSTLQSALDGVLVDGARREPIAQILAGRSGAIIPLLSSHGDYWRFFHERTLTIDTTAAGGNASLLAMQGA
jgi:RHH-type transcriptional regulator, proline utilization regulon repressor / proline dehydrogenase / delta 1-pyrroline-5-carboxylate dehydrogenase